jgi:DNA helicase HerA-like ATPase
MCPPGIGSGYPDKGTVEMIVIGADTHKRSHTLAAVDEATGRALGDVTVAAAPRSFGELCAGRAASVASGCGRLRIAGMSRGRWSGSCSSAASAWFAFRRS